MNFAALSTGSSIFLDTNTLVFHFQPHPTLGQVCNQLIQRINSQDLAGFTSTHVLSEVAHRMMLMEAAALPGWTSGNVKRLLQKQPSIIQTLSRFHKVVESILQSSIHIFSIAPSLILKSSTISKAHGLLSNDALIVAVMQANGLVNIASHDADFDRVPGIIRYAPA